MILISSDSFVVLKGIKSKAIYLTFSGPGGCKETPGGFDGFWQGQHPRQGGLGAGEGRLRWVNDVFLICLEGAMLILSFLNAKNWWKLAIHQDVAGIQDWNLRVCCCWLGTHMMFRGPSTAPPPRNVLDSGIRCYPVAWYLWREEFGRASRAQRMAPSYESQLG